MQPVTRLRLESLESRCLLAADLGIEIGAPHEVMPGEEVSYTVRFTNSGPDDAVGVDLGSDPTSFLGDVRWRRYTSFPDQISEVEPGPTGSLRITGAMIGGREMISQGDWGDFNGDGFDDLFFAVSRVNNNVAGLDALAYVIFGTEDGPTETFDVSELDGTNGFVMSDVDGGVITSVASAGDVNGDGIDDLLIGAAFGRAVNDHIDLGVSYLVYGSEERSGGTLSLEEIHVRSGVVIEGSFEDANDWANRGAHSGFDVSGAGDINADGFDDFAITSTSTDTLSGFAGSSYVVFGGPELPASMKLGRLSGIDGFRLGGRTQPGRSIAAGGDVNGDGIDDLLVAGWSGYFRDGGGAHYAQSFVLFGRREVFAPVVNMDELDGNNGFVFESSPVFYYHDGQLDFPFVSSAGDLNGDGLNDFVVGVPGTIGAGQFAAGAAYIVFGSNDGFPPIFDSSSLDGQNGVVLSPFHGYLVAGVRVDSAGDFNGDGIDDLVVETGYSWRRDEVRDGTYLILGSQDGYDSPVDLYELDGLNGTRFQGHVFASGGGDLNRDGLADLLLRHGEDVRVVFGRRTPDLDLSDGVGAVHEITDLAAQTMVTYEVSGTVKDSTSGSANFAAGAMVSGGRVDAASSATVVRDVDLVVAATVPTLAYPGQRISQELVVENRGYADAGPALIASNLSNLEDVSWTRTVTRPVNTFEPLTVLDAGEEASDNVVTIDLGGPPWGTAGNAEPAGDINGDGLPDLLVTRATEDNPGVVHVVYGTPLGFPGGLSNAPLDGVDGFTITPASGDRFAASIAAGGDINGDGFDDVLLVSGEGVGYVIFGAAASSERRSISVADLDGTNGFTFTHETRWRLPGALGDINSDGYDDIAFSGFVIFGAPAFNSHIDQRMLDGGNGFAVTTTGRVSNVGDVNNDGFVDLGFGVTDWVTTTFVLPGSKDGFAGTARIEADDSRLIPLARLTGTAHPLAAGDFNGDGVDDVVAGFDGDEPGSELTFSGVGISMGTTDTSAGFESLIRNRLGTWLDIGSGTVGDINHDGLDDVVGGDAIVFGTRHIEARSVLRTSLDSLNGENGFRFALASVTENVVDVQRLGDLNGDGFDEMLIIGQVGYYRDAHRTAYVWFAPTETEVVTGTGEIDHELSIGIGTRVRYEITGRLPVDVSDVVAMNFSVSANDQRTELDPSDNMAIHAIAIQPPVAGDLNLDGVVDFGDYLVLSANFGRNNVSASEGDLDGSGVIDFSDFVLLRDVFGRRF